MWLQAKTLALRVLSFSLFLGEVSVPSSSLQGPGSPGLSGPLLSPLLTWRSFRSGSPAGTLDSLLLSRCSSRRVGRKLRLPFSIIRIWLWPRPSLWEAREVRGQWVGTGALSPTPPACLLRLPPVQLGVAEQILQLDCLNFIVVQMQFIQGLGKIYPETREHQAGWRAGARRRALGLSPGRGGAGWLQPPSPSSGHLCQLPTFGNASELGLRDAQVVELQTIKGSGFKATVLKGVPAHL